MCATADTIWSVPVYLPLLQPQLTAEATASAEEQIGYKLPTEYLDLLKKQNGGFIRYTLPETCHDSIDGIGPHEPSLARPDWDECQEYVSFPLRGLVPFDGDGHWYLCLDYRRDPRHPSVTHADIECDRESRIADSFAGYLAMLQLDIEDEYVLEAVSDLEGLKSDLSATLGVTFDPPDDLGGGCPLHRATSGTRVNQGWLSLSPNTVPRGSSRRITPATPSSRTSCRGRPCNSPRFPPRVTSSTRRTT